MIRTQCRLAQNLIQPADLALIPTEIQGMNGLVFFFEFEGNRYRQLSDDEFFIVPQETEFASQFCGAAYGPDAPDVLFKKI